MKSFPRHKIFWRLNVCVSGDIIIISEKSVQPINNTLHKITKIQFFALKMFLFSFFSLNENLLFHICRQNETN